MWKNSDCFWLEKIPFIFRLKAQGPSTSWDVVDTYYSTYLSEIPINFITSHILRTEANKNWNNNLSHLDSPNCHLYKQIFNLAWNLVYLRQINPSSLDIGVLNKLLIMLSQRTVRIKIDPSWNEKIPCIYHARLMTFFALLVCEEKRKYFFRCLKALRWYD